MIGPSMNPVANPVAPVNPGGWRNPFSHGQGGDVGPERNRMPMFHDGTSYVPHTGPALLEKGEAVIPKEENMNSVKDVLSGHKKPKVIKEIRTRKVHGPHGKATYIHEHHHTHPDHHPAEEHSSANQDEMASHMLEHMGEPNPGEQEADAGQSGIPEGGAPPQGQMGV
jgi:hypothetical protein